MRDTRPLDQIDRRILEILQDDGRISNHRLSELVNLSPSACLARVRRLESDRVITGYRAQVDAAKIGPSLTVFAELTLSRNNIESTEEIEAALVELPELTEAWEVSGRYDILARFLVPDMERWTQLAAELAGRDIAVETVRTVLAVKRIKLFSGVHASFGRTSGTGS
ncbi:MAG: Lrp/AsnC family transcriptional regulator [Parvularcula sp.]|nr:Lrp/AsnC family transcriptional regulator [Parvularcula sp.]